MKNILIVDDMSIMRAAIAYPLKRIGYTIFEAGSGTTALKYLEQGPVRIDLIITDMNMPVFNGAEVIRVVRSLPSYQFVPVIGVSTIAYKDEMQAAGATAFLEKPFSDAELAEAVRKVLR